MRAEELETRNTIMAAYVLSLSIGDTILATSIKHSTILKYIKEAVKVSTLAFPKVRDPTIGEDGNTAGTIAAILKEIKREEKMPHRREPLTKAMVLHQQQLRRDQLDDDGIVAALADWLAFGLLAGPRRGKWAQESCSLVKTQWMPDGKAHQFVMSDFVFYDKHRKCLPLDDAALLAHAASADIYWRYQKNGDHGQYITFTVNVEFPDLCPVQALLRIRRRAQRLGVASHEPVACFRGEDGSHRLISSDDIRDCLRNLATLVYGITDKTSLSLVTHRTPFALVLVSPCTSPISRPTSSGRHCAGSRMPSSSTSAMLRALRSSGLMPSMPATPMARGRPPSPPLLGGKLEPSNKFFFLSFFFFFFCSDYGQPWSPCGSSTAVW